ncbi:MAG: formylglycine-generating enzyme family protein, partial [SAR324 cluster bacterium]|nr:formylglycine-generating enzyme family protein [SAR324 cluster bacterium]
DVQKYIQWLNQTQKGKKYRLCTEAEWEYAARAGTRTKWVCGDEESCLGDYAWYNSNSGNKAHPVKTKKANAWGLYDMGGNVWEWVQDWYGNYSSDAVTNPAGASSGSARVIRGGGFLYSAGIARSAARIIGDPSIRFGYLGFRLCSFGSP